MSFCAEQVAGVLQMREVAQLERDVMHGAVRAGDEIHRVMVGVAAHEHEEIVDPVRHLEAQHARVELRDRLGIVDVERDVAELEHADAGDVLAAADRLPLLEQLDRGALGILERQHLAEAGRDVALASGF